MPKSLIKIGRKTIRFEDGASVTVQPFEIAQYPITVADFHAFVRETGYVTTAAAQGDSQTYEHNDTLDMLTHKQRLEANATCLSFHDAVAFCKWARVRLPTEAEWLAAAVLDWSRTYDENQFDGALDAAFKHPLALRCVGLEWTATLDGAGQRAVLRSEPTLALGKDWQLRPGRLLVPLGFYAVTSVVRVCSGRL